MKTNEMLAELKKLATKAGEAIFNRAGMAAKILADKQWIDAEFSGDYDKALDAVEADCFPELCSAFRLRRLLILAESFTTLAEWRQHKFNLVAMWAVYEENKAANKGDRPKAERRKVTLADFEEREQKIEELEWAIKNTRERVETKEAELQKKETEVERLRRDNDELRGEIKALNRMIEQMRQGNRQVA